MERMWSETLICLKKRVKIWLGRQDSNLRMPTPKTGALPLGDAPIFFSYITNVYYRKQNLKGTKKTFIL